jgi:CRP/FNR family cyclic AMP-dependent transcriptional regulator
MTESVGPSRVLRALGIRGDEVAKTTWLVALFAVTQASHGLGFNAADALFFLRFGVEMLPLMILLSGPAVMALVLVHGMGLASRGVHGWLWMATLGAAGWAILEWLGVRSDLPGIYPVVWISTQVIIMVTLTVLWNAAGAACTTRQAKRLFPIFATAGVAGGVVGNLLTGPLAGLLGTENLLVVQGSLLLLGALLLVGARRHFAPDETASSSMTVELRDTWATIRKSPMLRLAAGVAVALYALFHMVYFPFSESVASSFASEAEVASFLGVFSSIATAATFLVSLLLANRLFARLGLVLSLVLLPVVYAVGFTLWLGSFSLATAAAVRGMQWVTANAIGWTAFTALFNVVTGRRRGQVLSFMTAVPGQLGTMAAGALLILTATLPARAMFGIGLVVSLTTVLVVIRLRPAYLSAVVDAVRQGVVGVFDTPAQAVLTPEDGDARRVLKSHLDDSRPEARALALAGLARLGGPDDAADIERLLEDPDPLVRAAAFDSVCEVDSDRVAAHAATAIGDTVPEVRLQVLHYLAANPGDATIAVAEQALDDTHPRVRAAAAVLVGGGRGERVIDELLRSGHGGAIIAALEETAAPQATVTVDPTPFLSHPDLRVRAAAVSALSGSAAHAGQVRPLLDDRSPRVRGAAAAVLATTPEGRHQLLDILDKGSVIASEAALVALTPMDDLPADFIAWARREAERAAFLQTCALALQERSHSLAQQYLARVLRMRIGRLSRWVLRAMATRDTRSVMPLVERGVRSRDPETKAQAIEALETMGARVVLEVLLPILEPDPSTRPIGEKTALHLLGNDFDPWLSSLAIRTLGDEMAVASSGGVGLANSSSMSPLDEQVTLSPMDRVLVLQRVPMFSELDPEDLESIARVATEVRFLPREPIYREGERGDELLVIVNGEVVVSKMEGSGPKPIAGYGPGEHVGELALLGGGVRSADVDAGERVVHGLVLDKTHLMSVLEERPEVAMGMLATLARRLVEQT